MQLVSLSLILTQISVCYENTDSEIERKQAVSVTQFSSNGSFRNRFLLWFKNRCRLHKWKIVFLMHDMKAYGRVELQLYSFLISAHDTGKWLAYGTGNFTRTG